MQKRDPHSRLSLYQYVFIKPLAFFAIIFSRTIALMHQWLITWFLQRPVHLQNPVKCLRWSVFRKYTLFFKSASVLLNFLINWASSVAYEHHHTEHHHTEALLIFTIFVSMSWSRSIYVLSMWSFFIFILIFIIINCIIPWIQTCAYFLEYVPLFLDNNVVAECE